MYQKEAYDPEKHEVDFGYRTGSLLRELAKTIAVDIEGVADTQGYIAEFTDVKSKAVNETFTPGGMFVITGYKVKVAGEDGSVGVYFLRETGERRSRRRRTSRRTARRRSSASSRLIESDFTLTCESDPAPADVREHPHGSSVDTHPIRV